MRTVTTWWRNFKDALNPPVVVPASTLLPRYRDTPSGAVPAVRLRGQSQQPAAAVQAAPTVAPPPWEQVFPSHVQALRDDMRRRGQDPAQWQITDGRDLGVSDAGHTIAFTIHKLGTETVITCELTLCKGRASLRVR